MQHIQFKVSAKTARLIGRENITDVGGAVIELIKNAYDADAACCFVDFFMPFPDIPDEISLESVNTILTQEDIKTLLAYYEYEKGTLRKKPSLTESETNALKAFLFAKNRIVVADNGIGMDARTLSFAWMNIGTNEKELRDTSAKGRIKTGAKGIGRFALDKLSVATTVYTKSKNGPLLKWFLDWDQFEKASLLEDVSATLETEERNSFSEVLEQVLPIAAKAEEYQWDTGTVICLSPIREAWKNSDFKKLNSNLRTLLPDREQDSFDIYINNKFLPEFNFNNDICELAEKDFDYRIEAAFDGKETLNISLTRNEIDTKKTSVSYKSDENTYGTIPLDKFWSRKAFRESPHKRQQYAAKISSTILLPTLSAKNSAAVHRFSAEQLEQVGPFSLNFYFLKNAPSTLGIVKRITKKSRKESLELYGGIKLYRDNFKVRPYGENGPLFDWLNLNQRVVASPSAVTHTGNWRVATNQLIGSVRISRDQNPQLLDRANREGLVPNEAYVTFVSIITYVLERFEQDRQYILREYHQWYDDAVRTLTEEADVIKDAVASSQKPKAPEKVPASQSADFSKYSEQKYQGVIRSLNAEKETLLRANRMLMLFSSAGIMTNTFSHELSHIHTDAASRIQQLRGCLEEIMAPEDYKGDPDANPFIRLASYEASDKLLEAWLCVLLNGVEEEKQYAAKQNLPRLVEEILNPWRALAEQKFIEIVTPKYDFEHEEQYELTIAAIDLYIVINNFILNSVWFLERYTRYPKQVRISIAREEKYLALQMENNGPPLDPQFEADPDQIFDAGVTTKFDEDGKKEGTGLGLWIMREVVYNLDGQIHVMNKKDGFGITVYFPV